MESRNKLSSYFLITVLGLGLTGFAVTAKADNTLREYLQNEISTMSDSLANEDQGVCSTVPAEKKEAWLFRRFFFRIRPNVTLTAGIASIGIVPDIELMWERPLPDGWTEFNPNSLYE